MYQNIRSKFTSFLIFFYLYDFNLFFNVCFLHVFRQALTVELQLNLLSGRRSPSAGSQ